MIFRIPAGLYAGQEPDRGRRRQQVGGNTEAMTMSVSSKLEEGPKPWLVSLL